MDSISVNEKKSEFHDFIDFKGQIVEENLALLKFNV